MKRTLIAIAAALTLGLTAACMHPYHHGGPGGPGGPCCQKRHSCCESCPNRAACPDCPNCPKKAPGAGAPAPSPAGKPCCPQAGQPEAK